MIFESNFNRNQFFSCEETDVLAQFSKNSYKYDTLYSLYIETTATFTSSRNTFVYSTPSSSCDENFKRTFLAEFKQLITELNNNFGICGKQECNFDSIRLKCIGDNRQRRDVSASSKGALEVSFETVGDVQMQQYLMRQLKENSTRFNVTDSILLPEQVIIGDLKATCQPGSILKDEKCGELF